MRVQLEIHSPTGIARTYVISPGVYSIGSDEDCRIRLEHGHVEGRHAILIVRDSGFSIEDLESCSGTQVAGQRIRGRLDLPLGQVVLGIGGYRLVLTPRSDETAEEAPSPPSSAPPPPGPTASPTPPVPEATQPRPLSLLTLEQRRSIKRQIHKELVARMDIKRLAASHIRREELQQRARSTIETIVQEVSSRLPQGMDPATLVKEVYDEALGLGPLENLLADDTITEIMVNGHRQIYVERHGRLERLDSMFMDDSSVLAIIERIVSPLGRRIDESQPYVDARLPDGSRVNAIIHPLSLVGPCLTIRKFSRNPFTEQDLIRFGTWTKEMAEFLRVCVQLRKNIIVSGGTGSGKTTLLNVLSSYLPEHERIVTIEDAAELRLSQEHLVRLEARPPNIEGRGAITIRDLVRNALRMRPDRIVVGECRGGEALDMLQAMNTGHDGSLTTVHANSPRDVISRLETMVLMSGMDLPVRAIRDQIASAIDLIVHENRFSDGTRKIVKVTEIVGQEGEQITMQDIFEFVQTGTGEDGRVLGYFRPTGAVPTFLEAVRTRGLTLNQAMFDPQRYSTNKL